MTPSELGREFAKHLKRGIALELPPDRQPTYQRCFAAWMQDLASLCKFAQEEKPEEFDELQASSEALAAFAEEVAA